MESVANDCSVPEDVPKVYVRLRKVNAFFITRKNFFLLQNEAMTGTHTQNSIYSRITLALMEDTGWYLPNYELADELKWGRGLGCDFALRCVPLFPVFPGHARCTCEMSFRRSCLDWMDRRKSVGESIHPFCDKVKRDPLETECTDDRSSVALCNLVQHDNELPPHFQVGGDLLLAPDAGTQPKRAGYYVHVTSSL